MFNIIFHRKIRDWCWIQRLIFNKLSYFQKQKRTFYRESEYIEEHAQRKGEAKKNVKRGKLSLSQRVFVKSLLILDFNSDCLKRSAIVVLVQVALISIQSNHFCRIFQPISSFWKTRELNFPTKIFNIEVVFIVLLTRHYPLYCFYSPRAHLRI